MTHPTSDTQKCYASAIVVGVNSTRTIMDQNQNPFPKGLQIREFEVPCASGRNK